MSKKVGRPSSAKNEVVVVQHMDTQETIAWSDGHFAGRSNALKEASRYLYATNAEITLGGGEALRIEHNAQGAALAMLAACAGRGRIISTDHGVLPPDDGII